MKAAHPSPNWHIFIFFLLGLAGYEHPGHSQPPATATLTIGTRHQHPLEEHCHTVLLNHWDNANHRKQHCN
jgi:hypothetical protein